MSLNTSTRIPGENDSYAIKDPELGWQIHGAQGVLDEQAEDEYVYKADLSIDTILKLDPETPIYAGVNSFGEINGDDESFTAVTNAYETAGDLIQLAKEILTDLTSEDPSSFQMDVFDQPMTLKTNVIDNQDALKEVMDTLYNGVTWQAMGSYAPDVYQDILDQPDAYPELFTTVYE